MLGTRGVRLGVIKPGLYAMQVRALMQAAAERVAVGGKPKVEVMIPLTVSRQELGLARSWAVEAIEAETAGMKKKPEVSIGTMVETPRAALRGRRDRRGSGLLQLRDQRPHPDDLRFFSLTTSRAG